MNITDANIKIIQDSRGKDTLSAELYGIEAEQRGVASVPAGKSTGTHEAFVLEPEKAVAKFQEIKPQILNREFESQEEFDNFLISLDGTSNKQNLGGNLILSLSLAFARLKAKSENLELFQYLEENSKFKIKNSKFPQPIFNVINGGAHAAHPESKLNFQEFQIIPEVKDFGIALGLGQEFYKKLKELLENKFGKENVLLGDEAGFSCPFKNDEEAIEILAELIKKYNYPLRIGLDIAATQFYKQQTPKNKKQTTSKNQEEIKGKEEGGYLINNKEYSAEELKDFYLKIIETYNLLSIEDPFYEEDFDSFALINSEIGKADIEQGKKLVITDDLTTTNPERLQMAINKKAGNAILIKPNQIGTITETLRVIKLAYESPAQNCERDENNWQVVVSHRSGETRDDFIADLAVGVNAWGIKAGAPAAPERMVKYNRILEIQKFKS